MENKLVGKVNLGERIFTVEFESIGGGGHNK